MLATSFHAETNLMISVLDVISYEVPSFPVIIFDLRKMKVQLMAQDGSLILSDGCIKVANQWLETKTVYTVF